MAVYEKDRARIVIRVVYDGPGRAGKTTNVEQLARIFGNKSGNELQVYPAATGRTIFFDWFSFDGGMIDGHQLQVQVITVPGHKSLDPRRAHILHTADVVVLVCDSAAPGQDAAREMLDSLREHLGKSANHVPLIVQANKQDLATAMLPHELGAALGLTYDIPVFGAQASAGVGVRETAIGAIRAAVRRMKRRTARQGMEAIVGQAGTADELRAALQAIEAVNLGRGPGERRSGEDPARPAAPVAPVDEARVVYIRSNNLVSLRTSGESSGPIKAVPSNMSDEPVVPRSSKLRVPVAAMFLETPPADEPPTIAAVASTAAPTNIHVPPPPVLGREAASSPLSPSTLGSFAALDDAPASEPDPSPDAEDRELQTTVAALHGETQPDDVERTTPDPDAIDPATSDFATPGALDPDAALPGETPVAPVATSDELDLVSPALPTPPAETQLLAPTALDTDAALPDETPAAPVAPPDEPDLVSSELPTETQPLAPTALATDAALPDEAPAAPVAPPDEPDLVSSELPTSPVEAPPLASTALGMDAVLPSEAPSAPVAPLDEPDLGSSELPTSPAETQAIDSTTPLPDVATPEAAALAPAEPLPPAEEVVHDDMHPASLDSPPSVPGPAAGEPAILSAEFPPGHVWPVPGGRSVLLQLAGRPLAPTYPEGHALQGMSFKSCGFHLRTCPEWRFAERDRGRGALLAHARRAARLGPLLPADIAVALAPAGDDLVLWHIVPDLPSLGAELDAAAEAERPRHLARLAFAYSAALRLIAREDLGLALAPHAFAEQDGRYVYIDGRLGDRDEAPDLASALVALGGGWTGPLVDAWFGALEQALPTMLTRDDVAALGFEREIAATRERAADETREAMTRLAATLSRCA